MTPQGWQNISPNRQRLNTGEAVSAAVLRLYPEAMIEDATNEENEITDQLIYPENDQWHIEIQTHRDKYQFGPYPNYDEAQIDLPVLTKQLQENTSIRVYRMPDGRIVAAAWTERRGGWSFVVLPKLAFEIGSGASLIKLDDKRFCIVPFKAEENPSIANQIDASYRRHYRRQSISE